MQITKELLRKHRLGLCTDEEKKVIEEWLEMEENSSTGLDLIKGEDRKKEQIWSQLSKDFPELEGQTNRGKSSVPFSRKFTLYATAAVILFTVGFFFYQSQSDDVGINESEQLIALKTIETRRGEKRTVTLSDGSTIRMNYETEISIPEQFKGDERIVYLSGHAHFNVVRDIERPFIIYTKDSKTQVLGTSFDINTKGADETEIVVTSGNVAFSEKGQEQNRVTLKANDRALLNADNNIEKNEVDAQKHTAWKDNRLVFDGQILREIIKVLEPWYDVEVSVKDPNLLNKDFRVFMDNPPLESIMEELKFLGEFNYRIERKKVIIY
ncbi:MAG: FecR domain-containing protein [Bacteroidota bacterium]